jgi:hypothetical protein
VTELRFIQHGKEDMIKEFKELQKTNKDELRDNTEA